MENKKYAIGGLVLLLLVVGVLAYWSYQSTTPPLGTREQSDGGSNSIVAADMRPSDVLSLDSVTLAHGGFVAIHEDANGTPGKIIGVSAYLPAGTRTAVPVKLSRTTKDGELLYALLHLDDGDQKFDAELDRPVLVGGVPVLMRFHVDKNEPGPGNEKL